MPTSRTLKTGLVQLAITPDVEHNKALLAEAVDRAAAQGARLVVLQELHNTPYFCQTENVDNFNLAEPIPGPSTAFYGEVARRNKVVLVTSLFERRAPTAWRGQVPQAVLYGMRRRQPNIYPTTPCYQISS